MHIAPSSAGTPPSDVGAPARAGALALALARAATTPGTSRSRLRALLDELRETLAASLVACYSADAGDMPRRVALVSAGRVATRKQVTMARNAATQVATARGATQKTPRTDIQPVKPHSSSQPVESLYVLPLEMNPRWLGLVVVWPDTQQAQEHAGVLTQVTPLLCALIPPLAEPMVRGARAGKASSVAWRDTAPARKTTGPPHAYIAALAHELRNPLNTLAGFLEIVLSEQVGPLNDRQREFLEYARQSAQRIASIIEQTRRDDDNGER
jgi:signal transduction histidine kinase